ncbi:OmpL47-type beta-barrel domain-containing protein [Paenibacillus harenae]|uniref:OmpL47-type beta-barrel domain-containing protein n=1 Tax=Paenibacillus harenae TaxID=306543 RepID=UPI00278E624E|nr:hypothetical protein [Paenibacillus harenae]MDQ0059032.1 hypothetical protein [Paenibacillus harenae]
MRKRSALQMVLVFVLMVSGFTLLPLSHVQAIGDSNILPLEGTITDANGNPAEGVILSVDSPMILGSSGGFRHLGSAVTDENGYFQMAPFERTFPDQNYPGCYISFTLNGQPVARNIGHATSFNYQLPAFNHIEGNLTIEGTDLPNAYLPVVVGLRVTKSDLYVLASTITDENGHYSMDYIPSDVSTMHGLGEVIVTSREMIRNRFYDFRTDPPAASTAIYGYVEYAPGQPGWPYTLEIDGVPQPSSSGGFVADLGDTQAHHVKVTAVGFVPYETSLAPGGPYYIQLEFASLPPVVQAIPDRGPDRNGWYNHNVVVAFEAQDNNWYEQLEVDPPKSVSTEGANQVITGSATDEEGLVGYGSVTISLDKTAPETTATLTAAASDTWMNSGAILTLHAADGLSGVATTSYSVDDGQTWNPYTGPVPFDDDGHYYIQYRSIDAAGNSEASKTIAFNLDQTGPVVEVMTPEVKRYPNAGNLVPAYRVTDAMSGVDPVKTTATLDGKNIQSGAAIPLYTMALGAHTFTVKATDRAGNETVRHEKFETYADIESLKALVKRFAEEGKIKTSVSSTLQKKLDQSQLKPFISLVEAHRGKAIDAAAAEYLLRDAQSLQ